jgi:hypothetical protein
MAIAFRILIAGIVAMLAVSWSVDLPTTGLRQLLYAGGLALRGNFRSADVDRLSGAPWLTQSTFVASSLETGRIGYLDAWGPDQLSGSYVYGLIDQPNGVTVDRETGVLSLGSAMATGTYDFTAVIADRRAPKRSTQFPIRLEVREGVTANRAGSQILHKIYDVDSGLYGGPTGQDYTTVLLNIRRTAIADQRAAGDGNLRAVIYFSRGKTYDYTVNDWLVGLQYVTVMADPRDDPVKPRPRLRNVRRDFTFDTEIAVLRSGGGTAFDFVPDKLKAFSPTIYSANPGQDRVRLKNAANAVFVKPGRWYLIGSYDQQLGGYPPNMRYFDYVKVTAINGDEVILDRRLRHYHRDDYFEERANPNSLGMARLIPLDLGGEGGLFPTEDGRLTMRLTVRGIEFVRNPSTDDKSNTVVYIADALDASFEDCITPHPVPTIVRYVRFVGGTIESAEPDKLVSTLILDHVRSGTIGGATGVDFFLIRNSRIAPLQVSPRRLRIVNSVIDGTTDTYLWYPVTFAYNGPVLSAEFESVTFKINPSNNDTRIMPPIGGPSAIVGKDADWFGNILIIPRSSAVFEDWQARLFRGMIVYSHEHPTDWGVVRQLSSSPDEDAIWVVIEWKGGERPVAGKLSAGRGQSLRIDGDSRMMGKASWNSPSGGFMKQDLPRSFGDTSTLLPTLPWRGEMLQ